MKFEERYRLDVPLVQSDRGTVWSGMDGRVSRKVVIAVAEPDAPEPLRARFAEQTAKLVSVRHANLLRVLDVGTTEEGAPYAALEAVEGEPLDKRMAQGPAMRVDQAVRMVADLCGALSVLHGAGIAHGDLHPGNVIVRELGGRVTPKLSGIGLNAAAERQGEEAPADLATLAYMAPAQARGEVLADPASDLYSAASLLFSLLTGRLPHRGGDASALREAVRARPAPAVGDVRAELAGPIGDVLDEALSPDPAKRFATADAFAKALRTALIRTRTPGALETIVGPRTIETDDSDEALAEARAARPPETPARKPGRVALPKPSVPSVAKPAPKPTPKASAPKPAAGAPKPALAKPSPALKPAAATPTPATAARVEPTPAKPAPAAVEPEPSSPPASETPSGEDSQEFERLSGLLEHPDWEPPPPPAPPASEPAPQAADESAEFERLSGLLEIPEPGPKPAPPPTPAAPSEVDEVASAGGGDAAADPAPAVAPRPLPEEPAPSAPAEEPAFEAAPIPSAGIPGWVWAAVGVAAAAVLVVVAVAMIDDAPADTEQVGEAPIAAVQPPASEPSAEDAPAEELPAVEAPEPPVEPAEPVIEDVVVTLTGLPEGATVTIDGEAVEGAEITLPPAEGERTVAVQLEGHEEFRRTVPGDRSAEIAVELQPVPEAEPSRAERRRHRARRRARQNRARRNTERRRSGRPSAITDPGF